MEANEAARQGTALVALRVGCLRIGTDGDEGNGGEGARAQPGEEREDPGIGAAPVNQFQVVRLSRAMIWQNQRALPQQMQDSPSKGELSRSAGLDAWGRLADFVVARVSKHSTTNYADKRKPTSGSVVFY